jgi:hypothetical protein
MSSGAGPQTGTAALASAFACGFRDRRETGARPEPCPETGPQLPWYTGLLAAIANRANRHWDRLGGKGKAARSCVDVSRLWYPLRWRQSLK